jgi:acetyl esterase
MTETSDSRARLHRVADVQLRGPAPRGRARVHWPNRADVSRPPALVVFFAAAPATPEGDDELIGRLVDGLGAVVLAVSAAHVIEAHATVSWAADHAAELGAEPDRLALVGHGSGAALAERVAELAVDEGWPPLRHVALIWPHDDPQDALVELGRALAAAPSGRAR